MGLNKVIASNNEDNIYNIYNKLDKIIGLGKNKKLNKLLVETIKLDGKKSGYLNKIIKPFFSIEESIQEILDFLKKYPLPEEIGIKLDTEKETTRVLSCGYLVRGGLERPVTLADYN